MSTTTILKIHNNLIQNEYNEIVWNVRSLESGLYFATIKSDKGEYEYQFRLVHRGERIFEILFNLS